VAGIVCALAAEARSLGPTTRGRTPVAALADGTLRVISGMGAAAAALGARALVEAGAGALVSFGLAGGLDPALHPGAICLPTRVVGRDGIARLTEAGWHARVAARLAALGPVVDGPLLGSTHAVSGVAEKARLHRATGAVAVDMESLAVAEVASVHGLPFLAIRVIVDAAGDELPRAVAEAADEAGHLRLARLLRAVATAPTDLPALLRLVRCYRAARRSLAAVARRSVWALEAPA